MAGISLSSSCTLISHQILSIFFPLVSLTSCFPFHLYCFIFLKHHIVHVTLLFHSGSSSSGFFQFHQPHHLHFSYLPFPWLIHVLSHCLAISSTVHLSSHLLNLGQSLIHTFKPTSGLTPSRKPCPSGLAGSIFSLHLLLCILSVFSVCPDSSTEDKFFEDSCLLCLTLW